MCVVCALPSLLRPNRWDVISHNKVTFSGVIPLSQMRTNPICSDQMLGSSLPTGDGDKSGLLLHGCSCNQSTSRCQPSTQPCPFTHPDLNKIPERSGTKRRQQKAQRGFSLFFPGLVETHVAPLSRRVEQSIKQTHVIDNVGHGVMASTHGNL